jgi:phospholipid-binding lipoprotein MlaA
MLKLCRQFLFFILTIVTVFNSTYAFAETNPKDPYEHFNRAMFKFNDFLDRFILKPVAQLYNAIVPHPLAKGLTNVYNNIDTIPTVINDVLQGNFYQATNDIWRLGINSTIGVLGLFDVAERIGLEPNYEDFGLTMARWGWTNSNFLMLPFFGPTTVRDGLIGAPVTYYGMSIYPYIRPTGLQYGIYFFGVVVRRADILTYEGVLNQLAFDKYVFMRDAYLQHRNYMIQRNNELSDPYIEKNKLQLEEAATASEETKAQEQTKPFAND